MSDTRDDGQGEIGYVFSQSQCVESTHVAGGTTSTDNHHHVEIVYALVDAVQGSYHTLLHLFALHNGRKQGGIELQSVVVVHQLSAEVAIACSCLCRYNGNALTEQGNDEFALEVEDALFLQFLDNLLSALSHITQGKCGVDIRHNP